MIYTIAISEAERNHISHILRMNMDDINGSVMDSQAYEAFVRGSIDNTNTGWSADVIAQREARSGSALTDEIPMDLTEMDYDNAVALVKENAEQQSDGDDLMDVWCGPFMRIVGKHDVYLLSSNQYTAVNDWIEQDGPRPSFIDKLGWSGDMFSTQIVIHIDDGEICWSS